MGGADLPLSNDLLALLNVISPNKTEMRRILNREIDVNDQIEILNAIKEMRNISNNKNLCLLLKLGSKGCLYVDQNNIIYNQSAFNFSDMPICDTTGAGDCFTATFVTQLLDDKCINETLSYSTLAAYLCITKFGAMPSMPNREEVENVLNRIHS